MNMLSDEILNKYIDGELNHSTLQHVNEVLSNSAEDKKRFQTLLIIHNELKKVKEVQVSDSFTQIVMDTLLTRKKAFKEQRHFVVAISSVFITIIAFVIGLIIYFVANQPSEVPITENYTQQLIKFFNSLAFGISQIFTPKGMSIFGSIISLGILISGYFFFENFKASKQNIHKSL